jgi:hypothetical protein
MDSLTLLHLDKPRSEHEVPRAWVNVFRSPEGLLSSNAHPSHEDCLDDLSSPAAGWAYDCTLVRVGNMATVCNFKLEALAYLERVNREWRAEQEDRRVLANPQMCGR